MDFDLSPEHALIRDTVRAFALERVAPVAEELDRESRFPYELVAEMAELGFMGIPVPEHYVEARRHAPTRLRRGLTRVDSSVAITVAAHTSLGTMPVLLFGRRSRSSSGYRRSPREASLPRSGSTSRTPAPTPERHARRPISANWQWIVNARRCSSPNGRTDNHLGRDADGAYG